MLKVDLHLHSKEDPYDEGFITYDAFQLIDEMAKFKFDVIALTLHETLYSPKKLVEYAKKKNILLIPGMEATVGGKHVLVLNPPIGTKNPSTFEELEKLKKHGAFIIAAHPYYVLHTCLEEKLVEHIDLFDAIEHCHFYTQYLNLNKKAIAVAEKYNKPIVANSDAHYFCQLNTNYTLIDADKNINSVFDAIRNNKIRIKSRPLTSREFGQGLHRLVTGWMTPSVLKRKIHWIFG